MAFVTLRKPKIVRGTNYGAGARYEIKDAATLAELFALRDDGSLRCFADMAPAWARAIVRDVTHYYNVAPHIKLLVSINARLSFEHACMVINSLRVANDGMMHADHCEWLLSDGTENLERLVQLFGAPTDRRVKDGPPQNYYLEFAYSSLTAPEDETLQHRLRDLFTWLMSVGRLEAASL